jgi:hypothetical protein
MAVVVVERLLSNCSVLFWIPAHALFTDKFTPSYSEVHLWMKSLTTVMQRSTI